MSLVTPSTVLKQVSEAVPEDCRHNIVVVGSLAAGYHFYGEDTQRQRPAFFGRSQLGRPEGGGIAYRR